MRATTRPWLAYAAEAPKRVLVLRYGDLCRDPVAVLGAVLEHAGLPRSEDMCELAVAAAWHNRGENRFNRGEEGRGTSRFTAEQRDRIARHLGYHRDLETGEANSCPDRQAAVRAR
ncbi:MAG: hypothetical protein WDM81_18860 [Rhizomicrobium sp.]